MAVPIVQLLEVVHVEQQQREHFVPPIPRAHPLFEPFVELAPVRQAGQRVGQRARNVGFDFDGLFLQPALGRIQLRLQILIRANDVADHVDDQFGQLTRRSSLPDVSNWLA